RELTTPPVTKMCLVMKALSGFGTEDWECGTAGPEIPVWVGHVATRAIRLDKSSILFGSINANCRAVDDADLNHRAVFESAELLEFFEPFQPTDREPRQPQQKLAPVRIKSHVQEPGRFGSEQSVRVFVPAEGNKAAAEIQGPAVSGAHHL